MKTKHFMVTSHGWSASNWVAHALDLNPSITCTHSARNEWAKDTEIHSEQNIKDNLKNFHSGYFLRQNRTLDESYDEIEAFDKTDFYGSVHLYRLRDLPVLSEKFGTQKRKFNVVNLIRNPIDLVWSGHGQFKDLFRYDINELYWTTGKVLKEKEFLYELAKKYSLNIGDFENLSFLGACAVLGSLRLDLDAVEKVKDLDFVDFKGFVKMEEVTSNGEVLNELIGRLTDNECPVPLLYLDKVYQAGVINKHKHDSKKLSAEERYATFGPWQKEAFHHFMKIFDLKKDYQKLGYDLSFMEE